MGACDAASNTLIGPYLQDEIQLGMVLVDVICTLSDPFEGRFGYSVRGFVLKLIIVICKNGFKVVDGRAMRVQVDCGYNRHVAS